MGILRIDIFLKLMGIFKTRTEAGKACKAGYVILQGSQFKSSREVSIGDIITITKPEGSVISIEVLSIPDSKQVSRKARSEFFRIVGPVL